MPNTILLNPDAGTPAVIEVGGVCYQFSKPSSAAPNVTSPDATSSDCGSCVCAAWTAGFSGLPTQYQITVTDSSGDILTIPVTGGGGTSPGWISSDGEWAVGWVASGSTCYWQVSLPDAAVGGDFISGGEKAPASTPIGSYSDIFVTRLLPFSPTPSYTDVTVADVP
jgi:hypothetical protein